MNWIEIKDFKIKIKDLPFPEKNEGKNAPKTIRSSAFE